MLQGVTSASQKCQKTGAPNFLQGAITRAQRCRKPAALKGAVLKAQQCHCRIAPASFIWCQTDGAEMPWTNRTKGRAIWGAQKCHTPRTLPNQFNGVIVKTQKCRDIVAPRERQTHERSNAETKAPLSANHRSRHDHAEMPKSERSTGEPSSSRGHASIGALSHQLQGAIQKSQRCHVIPAPTEFGP